VKDTRTNILDAAQDLIQRVGVNAMSYKHISDTVGIRKASIHHHFPKKENLVDELLKRCQISYGAYYTDIVNGSDSAPQKLRKLATVFANGLSNQKLCLVGSISTDSNTLQDHSCKILEQSIHNTVTIFSTVFVQGKEEHALFFNETAEDAAFAFFSFLVGTQIVARSCGGIEAFHKAAEVIIGALEK
jgi:TetR/AcrR family transcriptional repressor of nem operon